MILNTLPLFNWNLGIYGAIFMGLVFLGLIITLFIFMFGGKKKT